MLLRVKEDMSMGKIFETFAACNELPAKDLRFWLNGETIPLAETPRTLGLQDGAEIRVILRLTGGKPVILLYPPTQLEASVHLELSSDWSFSVLYPKPLLRGPPRSDDTLVSHVISQVCFFFDRGLDNYATILVFCHPCSPRSFYILER